jgi:hypothetical protein
MKNTCCPHGVGAGLGIGVGSHSDGATGIGELQGQATVTSPDEVPLLPLLPEEAGARQVH